MKSRCYTFIECFSNTTQAFKVWDKKFWPGASSCCKVGKIVSEWGTERPLIGHEVVNGEVGGDCDVTDAGSRPDTCNLGILTSHKKVWSEFEWKSYRYLWRLIPDS